MTPRDAQWLANEGELVVLDYINPVPGEHGHIVIVRPAVKTDAALAAEGPQTMQAGKINTSDGNAVWSFRTHEGAWPSQVTMWTHKTRLQGSSPDLEEPDPAEELQKPFTPLQAPPAP
jgi:hypothetical protein